MEDARFNLALVRRAYGHDSATFNQLLRRYRVVADELGCRAELERAARVPQRRPLGRQREPLAQRGDATGASLITAIPARAPYTARFKALIVGRLSRCGRSTMGLVMVFGDCDHLSDHWFERVLGAALPGLSTQPGVAGLFRDERDDQRATARAEFARLLARVTWPRRNAATRDVSRVVG